MTIALPTLEDIEQIRNLNHKYLIIHQTDAQRQGGFIRIEYSESELKRIIEAKEIVVAKDENRVVGYYLIGRKSDSEALKYQHDKAREISWENTITTDKIGYGCQVCIEVNHRNNGLFSKMLIVLINLVKNRYSYLLGSISDDNVVSYNSHINNGWKLIDSMNKTKYLIYNTNKSTI